jgi:hypothetical protein
MDSMVGRMARRLRHDGNFPGMGPEPAGASRAARWPASAGHQSKGLSLAGLWEAGCPAMSWLARRRLLRGVRPRRP